MSLSLFIPKNLDYFEGHFSSAPILAGVVQLHWAVDFIKDKFNLVHFEVGNLEVLKFKVVIIPEQHLTLTLTKKNNGKFLFAYQSEKGQHSSGRIEFKEKI